MSNSKISMSVIKRLPRYYRFLGELKKSGTLRISSNELSMRMKLTASQIRQDLNCFGGFGQQGYGYNVEQLYIEIGKILGVDRTCKTILVGAGNLGKAIASHMSFESRGFSLVGIFDSNKELIGTTLKNIEIFDVDKLDEFCLENKPEVAVLCIPSSVASTIVDKLIDLGVTGFWNFTHFDIAAKYPEVTVENVHLNDSLMTLSYQMKNK
ncbi:MAG: redox-sensing transcriptional repressor Rex [Clostridia bacterium]|nr:redox-sensing transcriptional repressor Rex [Clostridia bacterium]